MKVNKNKQINRIKTIVLSSALVAFTFTGCINSKNVPVSNQKFGEREQVKGVMELTTNVRRNESFSAFTGRLAKERGVNIIIDKSVPKLDGLPFEVRKITIADYLKLYGEVEDLKGNFYVETKGVKNSYFISFKELSGNKIKTPSQSLKKKKEKEDIKKRLLETRIELPSNISISETINILKDTLGVDINIFMTDRESFLKKIRPFTYKGSIKNLFSEWEYEKRLYIEYIDGEIKIKDSVVKQYQLNVPSLKLSNENTTISEEIDIYKHLEDKIKMFVPEGKKYLVDRSTQSVLAEGDRETLSKIQLAIDQFNNTYHSVIQLKINFYTVDVTHKEAYGVDLAALTKQIATMNGSPIGLQIGTGIGTKLASDESNLSFNFTKSSTQKMAIELMNNYGETRKLQSPILTTVNNVPTSINITTEKDYVKSIKETVHNQSDNNYDYNNDTNNNPTTPTTGSDSSTTSKNDVGNNGDYTTKDIETDKVKYGFELSALPIMSKNSDEITVILNPKFSDLVSMKTYKYSSGMMSADGVVPTNEIQLIEKATTDLGTGQIVKVKNGMTAVIGGYYLKEDADKKNTIPGLTTKDNIMDWVSSGKSKNYRVKELIIFITATKTN
jgi:type II secretory pathway component GspD/PulD (secretin)